MAEKLSAAHLHTHLAMAPHWVHRGDLIERTFRFADFVASMQFVNALAGEAERTQHHPDLLIKYNRVTVGYSTHDADGLTEKDFAGARAADGYAALSGADPGA